MQKNERSGALRRIMILSLCISLLVALNFGVQVSLYMLNLYNIDSNLLVAYSLLVMVSFLGYYYILHEYKKQHNNENA